MLLGDFRVFAAPELAGSQLGFQRRKAIDETAKLAGQYLDR